MTLRRPAIEQADPATVRRADARRAARDRRRATRSRARRCCRCCTWCRASRAASRPRGIEACAEILGITAAEVSGVATFYTMYKRRPVGDYHVGVCTNTLCAVMGGDPSSSGSRTTSTSATTRPPARRQEITLEHVECNAACDYAPVMMVNWEFFDNQTPESATELVDDLRAGKEVTRHPRRAIVHLARGRARARRLPRRPRRRGPGRRARLAGRPRLARAERLDRADVRAGPPGRAGGRENTTAAVEPTQRAGRDLARRTPGRDRTRHSDQPRKGDRWMTRAMANSTPVLSDNWDQERAWTLEAYEDRGGYRALRRRSARSRTT